MNDDDMREIMRGTMGDQKPYTMTWQEPQMIRGQEFEYDHWVQVVLPVSYGFEPERRYPVLWLMDGPYYIGAAHSLLSMLSTAKGLPEMIVVGVGHDPAIDAAEFAVRRTSDFFCAGETPFVTDPLSTEFLKAAGLDPAYTCGPTMKSAQYLAFLIDELRPRLASELPMADNHVLFGHSGGGAFCARALFERPGAFTSYIVSSAGGPQAMAAEEAYSESHSDLDANVYIGAGEVEAQSLMWAAQGTFCGPAELSQRLQLRQYPSLTLMTRVIAAEDHVPAGFFNLLNGLRFVLADDIAQLTSVYDELTG